LAGLVTLAAVWLGPLPALAPHRFSAHMAMHMGVVAVAAPLLGLWLARGPMDPARRLPRLFSAVPASLVELAVVWAWHMPVLHHLARGSTAGLIAEQGMFLASGLLVWISALGNPLGRASSSAGAGIVALLLTSMHMTLLGALLALSTRPLYGHAESVPAAGLTALDDQHLGGAIMLLVGGIVYMAGGLWLAARLLADRSAEPLEIDVNAKVPGLH
jgi:putative membrane protein